VVRIDEIGRAQAVNYDAMTHKPGGQAPELKYFLVQFVTKHYARIRATVKEQYAESLSFLEAGLAEATIAFDQRTQNIERFLPGTSDEIEIQVKNVTLDEVRERHIAHPSNSTACITRRETGTSTAASGVSRN